MARVLLVTWNGGGNQPPEIGVAQELRERGRADNRLPVGAAVI